MSQFKISLRIAGDDLDPGEITSLLGVAPHLAYRKGEHWKAPKGKPLIGRTGLWIFDVDDFETDDFEEAIFDLLSRVPFAPDVFRTLACRFKVELFCGLFLDEYNAGVELSAAVMKLLAQREISLDLDIYSFSGPEEEH
ncbi:DUF4279 domain-containing protein [Agrobacterium vitis]|uniref:DUF4279 domain-containing protein n=1 Tax=Agrobacterium vitis TaxID=373 RepID=UPI003D29028F